MSSPTAFMMRLKPDAAAEYERRHNRIWPELARLLNEEGIHDYSIFLGPDQISLFAVMRVRDGGSGETLRTHPVMRRWWDYMADLMVVHSDNEPMQWSMRQVFRLEEPSSGESVADA